MNVVSQRQRLKKLLLDIEDQGKVVELWWRDDDATVPSKALDTLTGLSDEYGLPLTLAVIPESTSVELATDLKEKRFVNVAVHGWSHANHAPKQQKKQELGAHRALEQVVEELERGHSKLSGLYPQQYIPMLVPPWNRIDGSVLDQLPVIGFQAVSVFGRAVSAAVPMINTHIDVIDWRGSRGAKPFEDLYLEIEKAIKGGCLNIGLLTHHLVHDKAAWDFLRQFFDLASEHSNIQWKSAKDLLMRTYAS